MGFSSNSFDREFYNNNPQNEFNQATDDFNSSFRWAVAGSIISGIVITIAVVAVIYVLIDCLRRTGNQFLAYKGIPTSEYESEMKHRPQSDNHVALQVSAPVFPVVPNSQVEFATMERFLCEMANEKPIRFSSDQLEGFTNNYSTVLGSGAYGVVFKGEFPNGIPVAVKTLTSAPDKRIEEQFMAEVSTIGRTYHINLVKLYGFCFEQNMRALVYEFMENGSLDKILFDERREIEWEKLRKIAIGTAKGIAYLHEECHKRIIHYDIKPGNILLDGDLSPKVADFGLAKLCSVETSKVSMTGCRGTPGYAAPELWEPYPVSQKCDVYSFGILLFEIIGRRRHHEANNAKESRQWLPRWTWDAYKNQELSIMLALCGIEEKNREKAEKMAVTALWCVQYNADARPSMSMLVKMLESNGEIDTPPNPFQHLEAVRSSSGISGKEDEDWTSSEETDFKLERKPNSNKPLRSTWEIESA